MITKRVLVMLVVVLVLLHPCAVGACSCADPATVDDAVARADSVFVGRVLHIGRRDRHPALPRVREPQVTVAVDVQTVWKGEVRRTIVLNTVLNTSSCEGYFFSEGAAFLIFAHRQRDGSLGVSLCSGTDFVENADAKLVALGAGQVPAGVAAVAPVAPASAAPGAIRAVVLIGIGGVIVIVGLLHIWNRRTNRS